MITVEEVADGWIAECLLCARRVRISQSFLDAGRWDYETVIWPGEWWVAHSWSAGNLRNDLEIEPDPPEVEVDRHTAY